MDRADDDSAELFVGAHELRRGWFTGSTGLCRRRRSAQDALGRGASLNGAGGELQVKLAQFTATRRAIHGALWHDLGCMRAFVVPLGQRLSVCGPKPSPRNEGANSIEGANSKGGVDCGGACSCRGKGERVLAGLVWAGCAARA